MTYSPLAPVFGLTSEAGLLIRDDHFHAGHHGAGRVAHGPGDLTGGRLGGGRGGHAQERRQQRAGDVRSGVLLIAESPSRSCVTRRVVVSASMSSRALPTIRRSRIVHGFEQGLARTLRRVYPVSIPGVLKRVEKS